MTKKELATVMAVISLSVFVYRLANGGKACLNLGPFSLCT
jgi:hypothetical protein